MTRQIMTFRELLHPVDPDEFLRDYYGKKPLHIPGPADKFEAIFSWEKLNELLALSTLWTERSFELARQGRMLRPEEYCSPGANREGVRGMRPNPAMVHKHLREGATLALDFVDLLTPELRSVAQTLEATLGAQVCASVFCSWQETQGYASHFDTQNVFACHFAGTKIWRLYDGRLPHAADFPGGNRDSYPQEQHERMKGKVQQKIVMSPGDLLYIPHGLYHEALSSSEASLHISFGSMHLTAHDFLQALMKDLPRDPNFREHLPALDDPAAHEAYLARLADRLRDVITQPVIAEQLRNFMRQDTFERRADFGLPNRQEAPTYRLVRSAHSLAATIPSNTEDAAVAAWILDRDFFSLEDLSEDFPAVARDRLVALLKTFEQGRLIEPI